jgi:hypothetical protein
MPTILRVKGYRFQNQYDESKKPIAAEIRDGILLVTLQDGRLIATPIDWYPRLARATPAQLKNFELWAFGVHWEEPDENISIEGMLQGIKRGSAQMN